jgi:hypothetical protein
MYRVTFSIDNEIAFQARCTASSSEEAVNRAGEEFWSLLPTLYIRVANYGTVKATELKPRKPAEQVCVAI